MASRTGLIVFGVIAIIIIIIVTILAIIYVTRIGAIVSTPFAPQGSVVQLKNVQTGGLLGICTISGTIACNEGNQSGDYASTAPNQTNPNTMKWTVNIDPTTQFIALQNVATGKYLSNASSPCTQNGIAGNLLSVQLDSITQPNVSISGWFGSFIPAANTTQLFVLNEGGSDNKWIGTSNSNFFTNTCGQMVSDGFLQAQINQTTFMVTILS